MKKLKGICFTASGYERLLQLKDASGDDSGAVKGSLRSLSAGKASEYLPELFYKGSFGGTTEDECITAVESLETWTKQCFEENSAILFVGAVGIAVRCIAPFVRDKLTDSPVIVMDEAGRFVIPLLSGHVGGANELAEKIAGIFGAIPVITTATDLNGLFAADLFAREQGLRIENREGIAAVSSKILREKKVSIGFENPESVDIYIRSGSGSAASEATVRDNGLLRLAFRRYCVGIGCRRGKSAEEILGFLQVVLKEHAICAEDIFCFATIDVKADEKGILELPALMEQSGTKNEIPVRFYSGEELCAVPGKFKDSDFVKENVGVGNVCERAAMRAAGDGARLMVEKQARDGVTIALAERRWKLVIDQN